MHQQCFLWKKLKFNEKGIVKYKPFCKLHDSGQ